MKIYVLGFCYFSAMSNERKYFHFQSFVQFFNLRFFISFSSIMNFKRHINEIILQRELKKWTGCAYKLVPTAKMKAKVEVNAIEKDEKSKHDIWPYYGWQYQPMTIMLKIKSLTKVNQVYSVQHSSLYGKMENQLRLFLQIIYKVLV